MWPRRRVPCPGDAVGSLRAGVKGEWPPAPGLTPKSPAQVEIGCLSWENCMSHAWLAQPDPLVCAFPDWNCLLPPRGPVQLSEASVSATSRFCFVSWTQGELPFLKSLEPSGKLCSWWFLFFVFFFFSFFLFCLRPSLS